MPNAVLRRIEHEDDRPPTVFRQAGDHQVLVEYEADGADLRLNFRVHALLQLLDHEATTGIREVIPGFRSVMVSFDPNYVDREELLDQLVALDHTATPLGSLVLPSRIIELPIAFDGSSQSRV